jgi:predicted CXXCH cytochrome family protein
MKRFLFLGVGSALLFTMGGMGSAQADNGPHSIVMGPNGKTTAVSTEGADKCANCHRAHTAQSSTLTKQAQPLLCLNCHDGSGSSLDVVDGKALSNGNGIVDGALRGGGFTTASIDTGAGATKTLDVNGKRVKSQIAVLGTPAPVTSLHQIDGKTTGTMWGNGTTGVGPTGVTLECGACHDPHGNGAYRILKANPDGASYQISAAIPAVYDSSTPPVQLKAAVPALMSGTTNTAIIPDQTTKTYTTTDYWDVSAPTTPFTKAENAANLAKKGTVTDGFLGGISAWCTTCHTRYLSTGASVDNAGDATYTYKHRSDEQANYKPDCIQCHVAHGTNAAMTATAAKVTAPDGTTLTGSVVGTAYQNSSLLRVNDRGTCLMCHPVGGPNPADVVAP